MGSAQFSHGRRIGEKRVFVVGSFPPPLHGNSFVTSVISDMIAKRRSVVRLNLAPAPHSSGIHYARSRFGRAVSALYNLLWVPRHAKDCLYIGCDDGLGIWINIAIVAMGRWKKFRLYHHHHSFRYIDERSLAMLWLVRLSGRQATHIFLCDRMRQKFSERYGGDFDAMVVSNAGFVSSLRRPQEVKELRRSLTVGFLSNLVLEKGVDSFLEVIKRLSSSGVNIRGVLAGPVMNIETEVLISRYLRELGSRLTLLGRLDAVGKVSFFEEIDVFLFPSRYRTEAQPLVVFEALAFGKPVITTARGCLGEDEAVFSVAAKTSSEYVRYAENVLLSLIANSELMDRARQKSLEFSLAAREKSIASIGQLVDRLS